MSPLEHCPILAAHSVGLSQTGYHYYIGEEEEYLTITERETIDYCLLCSLPMCYLDLPLAEKRKIRQQYDSIELVKGVYPVGLV